MQDFEAAREKALKVGAKNFYLSVLHISALIFEVTLCSSEPTPPMTGLEEGIHHRTHLPGSSG